MGIPLCAAMPVHISIPSPGPASLAALMLLLPGGALSAETEFTTENAAAPKAVTPTAKREPDPIPPLAAAVTDAESIQRVPDDLLQRLGLQLVLDRQHRLLLVLHE